LGLRGAEKDQNGTRGHEKSENKAHRNIPLDKSGFGLEFRRQQ
jgi:hypothetical protein